MMFGIKKLRERMDYLWAWREAHDAEQKHRWDWHVDAVTIDMRLTALEKRLEKLEKGRK